MRFHGRGKDVVPNSSGSAPPSMEGSFLAIESLLSQNTTWNASLGSLNRDMQKDDSGKGSLYLSRGTLATHKEESEDYSTQQMYDNELDKAIGKWHRQDVASTSSQHTHLVMEDFPHNMSPVYNKFLGVVDELIGIDTGSSSSHGPPVTTVDAVKPTIGADDIRLSSTVDSPAPVTSSSSLNSTGSMGFNDLHVTIVESQLRALSVSNLPNSESRSYEDKWENSFQNNLMQHQLQNYPCEVPSTNSQSEKCTYVGMEQFLHNPSKFSSDASGIYSLQYVGAYPFSLTAVPPYIAAYPPHGSVPLVDGATGSSFTPQAPGVSSTAGNNSHGAEMMHAIKFFGQFGFPLQPSFGDPIIMQYHQQPFAEGYGVSGHLLAPRASVGGQIGPFDSQKRPSSGAYLDDKKKLESCCVKEKELVFKEVLPHTSKLMTDVFGNYVIQKFFEYGSPEQRKELANRLLCQIPPLGLQMYGCCVVQKALEAIDLEQKAQLVHELDGNVMRCRTKHLDHDDNKGLAQCFTAKTTTKLYFCCVTGNR
ncbi:hypothetical protein JHK87_046408 [Glycine soja]|nr:hypothetical protein JHK87_046408 [Glycine soja]